MDKQTSKLAYERTKAKQVYNQTNKQPKQTHIQNNINNKKQTGKNRKPTSKQATQGKARQGKARPGNTSARQSKAEQSRAKQRIVTKQSKASQRASKNTSKYQIYNKWGTPNINKRANKQQTNKK